MSQTSQLVFSIEGNIGSGKSTIVNILREKLSNINKFPQIFFLAEPVDDWNSIRDENGVTILEKFYENQNKYAFSFQIMAYISRLAQIKKILKRNYNAIIITERSVLTDREVFARMLYDDNKIEKINYNIYLKWFDTFIEDIPLSGIIYINTDVETCQKRIKLRGRTGEMIPQEYSQKCKDYHDRWLTNTDIDVLELDGNTDFKTHMPVEWMNKIMKFIRSKQFSCDEKAGYYGC